MLFGAGETTTPNDKPLGFIAQKYESGDAGPGTIADTPGDGGGKAYGTFQMDIAFGHVAKYVAQSEYASEFAAFRLGSPQFDAVWRNIAEREPKEFERSQRQYIVKMFFDPAIKFAEMQGYSVVYRAIKEVVFSIAVQHGGYRTILRRAKKLRVRGDTESEVRAIYSARRNYVNSLSTLTDRVKVALMNRYYLEEQDVLAIARSGLQGFEASAGADAGLHTQTMKAVSRSNESPTE